MTRFRPGGDEEDGVASWWGRYSTSLDESSLSRTARIVLDEDCRYTAEKGVAGDGDPGDPRWPDGRVRRGIVMGSVQSGKTASMIGVAALSLDASVDMVVILAGTRTALWRQTYDRVVEQLDRFDGTDYIERSRERLMVPEPALMASDDDHSPADLYAIGRSQIKRAVRAERPIIAIVMKNVHHLRAVASLVRDRIVPVLESTDRPFHLLVLDDEADDGSILDANVERDLNPAIDDPKQIPRAIVDLWETRPHSGRTASERLFATYIGYTATPQANFLQSDHNPLAPKEFAIALRTPFDAGELAPRSSTYREPRGLGHFYTGGETYYERLSHAGICTPTTVNGSDDLADAIRSFLIAGAIRVWRGGGRLGPNEAQAISFDSRAEAVRRSPPPHSMLFHPSAGIADHFLAAANVLEAACGMDRATGAQRIHDGDRDLPIDAFERTMVAEEGEWVRWLERFQASAMAVQRAFDLPTMPAVPDVEAWQAIRSLILKEVVPSVRIKVVNSDPDADDRPEFFPVEEASGSWRAGDDLCTIFVSGNVMSRGLTLEGLTTTLFLRSTNDPYADTQMQMQRWFGYRGDHLDLCRLFLPRAQLDLFSAYHDTDEALRRSVLAAMNESVDEAPDPVVLQGRDFSATGKLTNVSNVPLCPGATPFVRLVNDGEKQDPNVELIARTFTAHASSDVTVRAAVRGRILDEPVSLLDAADLLDGLRYDNHRPTVDGWEGRRWTDLVSKVGIRIEDDGEQVLPLFRPPDQPEGGADAYSRGGPYAISAYFRLWKACLTRHARGLVATDDERLRWSMLDLRAKERTQPRFYVGIRYGSGLEIEDGAFADLPFRVRAMSRQVADGQLAATWGTRNPASGVGQYLGDALFDYHVHDGTPPTARAGEPMWRPVGAPGLILFHVIEREDVAFPTVAVGVAIPLGGPDQFAARSRSRAVSAA